jgi:hypothetical protein
MSALVARRMARLGNVEGIELGRMVRGFRVQGGRG